MKTLKELLYIGRVLLTPTFWREARERFRRYREPLEWNLDEGGPQHPRLLDSVVTLVESFQSIPEAKNYFTFAIEYEGETYNLAISKQGVNPWKLVGLFSRLLEEANIDWRSHDFTDLTLEDQVRGYYETNGIEPPTYLKRLNNEPRTN